MQKKTIKALPYRLKEGPVVEVVGPEPVARIDCAEDAPEVAVVGPLVELQAADVVEVEGKFGWKAAAEDVAGRCSLLEQDLGILVLLVGGAKALPGKAAAEKVEQDVAERLKVVAPALLDPEVRVEACIAGGAGQGLVLPVGDVEEGAWVAVPLGQPKVDQVAVPRVLPQAHHKVVRLDVAVEKVLVVHVLDPLDHLVGEHQNRL